MLPKSAARQVINQVVLLPVEAISPNPGQPRKRFPERGMLELMQSIVQNGLLQPITVRQVALGEYQLIAGERRLQAFLKLGCVEIPALIEEVDDLSSMALALIENLQRENLNFFEEASALEALQKESGLSQSELARRIGQAQSTLANRLRLLRLSEPIRERILDENLSERHARALLTLNTDAQIGAIIDEVVKKRLNVQQTEQLIANMMEGIKPKPTRLFILKDVRIFINTINKAVEVMKQAGIPASSERDESEEYISVTVRIPKKAATRQKGA